MMVVAMKQHNPRDYVPSECGFLLTNVLVKAKFLLDAVPIAVLPQTVVDKEKWGKQDKLIDLVY